MNNKFLTKSLPHITAVLVFLIVTFMYLSPSLGGNVIFGHDTKSYVSASKEAVDYTNTHDGQALWTNSMFGGMPTYQICMAQHQTVLSYIDSALRVLPGPTYQLFLYLIGFYILLLAFRVNPWLSIAGAIAFALGSYNLIIIVAGHNTKAVAIAYMAPIIGSIYLAFRGKKWLGAVLLALFLGLSLFANHVQITYYTLFIVLCFGVSELIFSIKEKKSLDFLKTVGILLIGVIVAVGMNATRLLTTAEYANSTMRGETNGLSLSQENSQKGLSDEYITQWSYGIDETFTLLIPNFKGGASVGKLSETSATAQEFAKLSHLPPLGRDLTGEEKATIDRTLQRNPDNFNPKNLAELMYAYDLPLYFGTQPFTSGPVYVGAIICFLFVLGLMVVPKRERWWLLAVTILGILLSWGKNFMPFTEFFINHIPMYNKFRTVSMTLTISAMAMVLMAILALKEIFNNTMEQAQKLKYIYISLGIAGGLCLVFWILPSLAGSFSIPSDGNFQGNFAFMKDTLPQDRADLLSKDAFRSFIFILIAASVLWMYTKKKLNIKLSMLVLGILILADMLPIAKRYLNESNFVPARNVEKSFQPTPADAFILQDKDPDFRVLNTTVDVFNSSEPAYFYKTIGGYHAAKMRRYQELIDVHLAKEIQVLNQQLRLARSEAGVDSAFQKVPVLNMLNMKYFVYHDEAQPLFNKSANGNVWLVSKYKLADNPNEEMLALSKINLKKELVADKQFGKMLSANYQPDSSATIALKNYSPNELVYTFNSRTDQLAVFSEIYYDKGWNAYINNKNVPYFRADYLLRAMPLKAGNYEITFRFEPNSYKNGNILSLISSMLLTLGFVGIIFARWKKSSKSKKI